MRHNRRLLVACLTVCVVAASGCFIGDKCDANQVELKAEGGLLACECVPGAVLSARGYGCERCGANQEVVGEKCVCKPGFNRASDSAPCKVVEGTAPGSACETEADCGEPNPFCAKSESKPYCTTQGCDRNDDCPQDWRCAAAGAERFCQQPPSGLSKTCQTDADCTDDVAYCETLMSHTCIMNDCVQDPGKCLSQSVCCDLTSLISQSLCVSKASLTDGKCYGGADPVTP